MNLAECVSVPGDFLQPQGAFLPGLYPHLEGLGFQPAPEAPQLRGMPTGPPAFLGMLGACRLRPCARTHLKKGLVLHLPVRWGEQQIPQINIGVIRTVHCPVGWGCRIHWLLLCRGVRPLNECPGYDTKQSDGEVPAMLELWGMRSTPSLPSLPGPLWPGVVAPDKGPIYGLNRTKPCFFHYTDFCI